MDKTFLDNYTSLDGSMFWSTIIPTIGRPTLARAVNTVLAQGFSMADFEIIVVNDAGKPLPPAEWQQAPNVKVVNTERRERSVARNTGAAIAGCLSALSRR